MNTRRYDLVGLGECMVELRGDAALGGAAQLACSYGGDVLNALVAAARQGGRTGFVSRVGDDPFGAALRAKWRGAGVDISQAPPVAGENGVDGIALLAGGGRDCSYRRSGSAASRPSASDIHGA